MATPPPVYAELNGSPKKEQYTLLHGGGVAADRIFMCDWADRHQLLTYLFEYPNNAYPYGPYSPSATTAVINGWGRMGGSAGAVTYEAAIIFVHYTTWVITYDGTRNYKWFSESISPAEEYVSLEPSLLQHPTGTSTIETFEAPSALIEAADYKITLYNVTSIPNLVWQLAGTTNLTSMATPTLGVIFDPETLIYRMPRAHRTVMISGSYGWTLEFTLGVRPNGANKFPRVAGGGIIFEEVEDLNGTVAKPYTPADWTLLFG